MDADFDAWDPWHPAEAAGRLAGLEAPWYVAAGWALDLFLGGQRREHEDLEVAAPAARFDEVVAALDGFDLYVPGREDDRDRAWPFAEAGDRLDTYHQTWVRDRATNSWRMDVFREPSDGDTWICRRDESIRLPYGEVVEHTADGIPYGRPEIILLFKAKHSHLDKNKDDFAAVLPHLSPERRRWLADSLALAHPRHEWLEQLP